MRRTPSTFRRSSGSATAWKGRRVLITSGPTREHLDPVRFLTNASSGRMGRALARQALRLGAAVTVVTGPAQADPPAGARVVRVTTAAQMLREVLRRSEDAAVVIGAAAVSDWRFASRAARKVKRGPGPFRAVLLPNPDIIKAVSARRERAGSGQVVVGFALETNDAVAHARRKLREKRLDMVVANGARSLGSDRAAFSLVGPERAVSWGRVTKEEAARRLFREVGLLLDRREARRG